jgi:hypothetical protein
VDEAGADASRILQRKFREFTKIRSIPADASGAYRPGPQAKTESLPEKNSPIFFLYPPSLKDYFDKCFSPGIYGKLALLICL